jgi:myosin heavy subunit
MFYVIFGLILLGSIAAALYFFLRKSELSGQVAALLKTVDEQTAKHAAEVRELRSDLARFERLSHIPGVIEKARRSELEITEKLELANIQANEIVRKASEEAATLKEEILRESMADSAKAKETLRLAETQSSNLIAEAERRAKEVASQARKEAKEKTQKVVETLDRATAEALEIRKQALERAAKIAGSAFEALKKHEYYEAATTAMENVIKGYDGTYMVPPSHILDELANEYGFHRAGVNLKVARERTRIMEKNGTAATCNYPDGWKKDYAINFVLSAFNGKVDSILARVKPANQ